MFRHARTLGVIPILVVFFLGHFADASSQPTIKTPAEFGHEKGLQIVLVVDVSATMRDDSTRRIINRCVNFVYDSLKRVDETVHLVTFSDDAKLFRFVKTKQALKDSIANERRRSLKDSKLISSSTFSRTDIHALKIVTGMKGVVTLPEYGLSQVFRLQQNGDSPKRGIVLFISDGEDNSGKDDKVLKDLSVELRIKGFSFYSIFVNTEPYASKRRMDSLAVWAGTDLLDTGLQSVNQLLRQVKTDLGKTRDLNLKSQAKVDSAQAAWKKQVENRETENRDLIANQHNLLILLGILSAILLAVIVFAVIWQYKRFVESRKSKAFQAIPVNMLWGKLVPENGKPIDLSRIEREELTYRVTVPSESSALGLSLSPENRNNKKVIIIDMPLPVGRIDFLSEDKKTPCDNQYIDSKTSYIKINTPGSKRGTLYGYHFLDKLEKSYQMPVWLEKGFFGHADEIQKIKQIFLNEVRKYFICIVFGMGNSGKTSLLRRLHEIEFQHDERLQQKYFSELVEFKETRTADYPEFEKKHLILPADFSEFKGRMDDIMLQLMEKKKERRAILFIDEYDKAFDKYGAAFGRLIFDYNKAHNNSDAHNAFFVLAGQKSRELLPEECANSLQVQAESILVQPIDDPINILKNGGHCEFSKQLIDFMLEDIGFRKSELTDDTKNSIIRFSSGFPFLTKRILRELLFAWLNDYRKHPLTTKHVEDVVPQIAQECIKYKLKRACAFDLRGQRPASKREKEIVSISEILIALAAKGEGKGKVKKDLIRAEVVNKTFDRDDKEIKRAREQSFDQKLWQLQKQMGFVVRDGEYLIGIPHLFFYKGEETLRQWLKN